MYDTFIRGFLRLPENEGGAGGGGNKDEKGGGGNSSDNADDAGDDESSEEDGDGDDQGDEDEDRDLSEDEEKEAKALYAMLKDPKQQKAVVRALAERAGINFEKPAPKTDEGKKKESKKVVDILSNALGDEFKFMTPKLAAAIEEILTQEREQYTEVTQRLDESMAEQEIDNALSALRSKTKGESKKYEQQMLEMSNKVHQAPGTSIKEYIDLLWKIVKPEDGTTSKDLARRINRNRTDSGDRLKSSASNRNGSDKGSKSGEAPKGLRAIIEAEANKLLTSKK